jgi:hypothetical protein
MYFTSLPFQPHLFTQSLCPLWETLASPFCESHCKKQVYLLPWNFSLLILTKLVWVALLCLLAESTSLSNLPAWAHSSPSFWTLAFTKLFWPQSFAVIYKLYSPVPAQPCHNQDPCLTTPSDSTPLITSGCCKKIWRQWYPFAQVHTLEGSLLPLFMGAFPCWNSSNLSCISLTTGRWNSEHTSIRALIGISLKTLT